MMSENRFVFECAFQERHLPAKAGFTFHPDRKRWETASVRNAARLREYADDETKTRLSSHLVLTTPWTGGIPSPDTLTPKVFQLRAARFALERNRSYLALRPGLGKTVVACLIANAMDRPVVYVCPPSLVANVTNHFETWAPTVSLKVLPDTRLAGMGTDKRPQAPLLIVDEAQRFNNPQAQRTKALLGDGKEYGDGLMSRFDRVVFMSGTPMRNRPMDLYSIVSRAAPECIDFADRHTYGMQYCGGYRVKKDCPRCMGFGVEKGFVKVKCAYCQGRGGFTNGFDYSGATNQEQLLDRLHRTFMLSISKEEALPELPKKREEIVVLSDAMPARLAEMDARLLRFHSPEDVMRDVEGNEHVSTYRKNIGIHKCDEALKYIEFTLDCGTEKLLVFAHHKAVVSRLFEGLSEFQPLLITGATATEHRQGIVDEFQKNPARKVIILNLEAGGVGFTLTAADRAIMVEFPWVPADCDQAADRIHRIGQTRDVFIEYLVFKNSMDRAVLETVLRKRKVTSVI